MCGVLHNVSCGMFPIPSEKVCQPAKSENKESTSGVRKQELWSDQSERNATSESRRTVLPPTAQSDDCILCCENIAEVMFPCGHRIVCKSCALQMHVKAQAKGKVALCPVDRAPIEDTLCCQDTVQYHPVMVAEDADGLSRGAVELVSEGLIGYKLQRIGEIRPGDQVTKDMLDEVKEAMAEVKAGSLEYHELHALLQQKLTVSQMQLVYAELCSEMDLHGMLLSVDELYLDDYKSWKSISRELIIGVYEPKAWKEMTITETLSRAGATTAAAGSVELYSNGFAIHSAHAFSGTATAAAGGAAGAVCALFSGFEVHLAHSPVCVASCALALPCALQVVKPVISLLWLAVLPVVQG